MAKRHDGATDNPFFMNFGFTPAPKLPIRDPEEPIRVPAAMSNPSAEVFTQARQGVTRYIFTFVPLQDLLDLDRELSADFFIGIEV